ncbi:hypothetical protein EYZ11_005129 [Aspergillus tanneri]|uniref:Uncharacterized protein n=1 Tax=Aspergillus tanneri TaxID=1220188 RepID=A0A4S3JJE7_9EURO|nr:uncharacterized protein ATNIH1004_008215 [Aspergillus tanneri]KAA8644019.1 hypothetical protein ATNIH1004_008215 [Aspergillus tanneri]THC95405.1 hypothetical protein EYZ11_005129 [Aspergillus tanneri]
MNNNLIIATIVILALTGCACGWLYSLRWRSEVRDGLLEASADVRQRKMELRAISRGRAQRRTQERSQTRSSPQPARPSGSSKRKPKVVNVKKTQQRQKQPRQQQTYISTSEQDQWGSRNDGAAPAETTTENEWANADTSATQSTEGQPPADSEWSSNAGETGGSQTPDQPESSEWTADNQTQGGWHADDGMVQGEGNTTQKNNQQQSKGTNW